MSHTAIRQTRAHRHVGYVPTAFARERRSSVLVEPAYPEWMTWAQRAVYRHLAFNGRIAVPSDPDGCWTWLRSRVAKGYGRVRWDGGTWWAHRLSRFIAFGDAPEAVCHTCDNPPCVNPEHLRSGTLSDNTAEMWAKGRAVVTISLTPATLALAEAALAALPPRGEGRRARVEQIAASLGCSYRTLYRLLSPNDRPLAYRAQQVGRAVA